jgi:hypothetical protein
MVRRLPVLAVIHLCACGGSTGQDAARASTVSVSGIVDGTAFIAAGVVGALDPIDPTGARSVLIAEHAITCADLAHFLSGRSIDIEAFDSEGCPGPACAARPVPAGTYSILRQISGRQAAVDYSSFDSQCAFEKDIEADVGGTITITKAGLNVGDELQGSFDVIIGGNRVTGSFQTTICPIAQPDHVCR